MLISDIAKHRACAFAVSPAGCGGNEAPVAAFLGGASEARLHMMPSYERGFCTEKEELDLVGFNFWDGIFAKSNLLFNECYSCI